jgi:hypothetical protein
VAPQPEPFWARVLRARTNIATGLCEDYKALSHLVCARSLATVCRDFDRCAVGDGHRYRDLTAELLAHTYRDVFDLPLAKKETASHGGRFDIEFPLCAERLANQSLWASWHNTYRVRSVIVEAKNEAKVATIRDVQQLLAYLVTGRKGKLGILVCRKGFSRCAMTLLAEIAACDEYLILPLAHDEVKLYAKRSRTNGLQQVQTLLRRKQTILLQSSR